MNQVPVDRMIFDKDTSSGYLANHMARLFAQRLQERIAPLGISTGQFPALLELWEEDGLTQKELIARVDIEQATMANTLTRMERDGLILRKPNPEDGRSQRVFLTDKARALHGPATELAASVNALALQTLTGEERETFVRLMRTVIGSLRRPLARGR